MIGRTGPWAGLECVQTTAGRTVLANPVCDGCPKAEAWPNAGAGEAPKAGAGEAALAPKAGPPGAFPNADGGVPVPNADGTDPNDGAAEANAGVEGHVHVGATTKAGVEAPNRAPDVALALLAAPTTAAGAAAPPACANGPPHAGAAAGAPPPPPSPMPENPAVSKRLPPDGAGAGVLEALEHVPAPTLPSSSAITLLKRCATSGALFLSACFWAPCSAVFFFRVCSVRSAPACARKATPQNQAGMWKAGITMCMR